MKRYIIPLVLLIFILFSCRPSYNVDCWKPQKINKVNQDKYKRLIKKSNRAKSKSFKLRLFKKDRL